MKTRILTLVCSGLLATVATSAHATELLVESTIPFTFVAGHSVLPAGNYEIAQADPNTNILEIRNQATARTLLVPYVTRLAARPDEKPVLVFDVQGSQKYLSELHAPAMDGFSIEGARDQHTHQTIAAQRKK